MVYVGELCLEDLVKPVFTLIQAGVSCKWAHDSQCFLLEFFDTIHNSPSQIYHSALLLSPSSSWVRKCYNAELSQVVKVVKGLPAEWGMWSRAVSLDEIPLVLACQNDIIAVGLTSGDIITLNGITGSQVAVLPGHTNWVESLAFSLDGTSLVSGSYDHTLKLWDIQTGGVVKTFHGHTDRVHSVSISTNHTTIASGSNDKTICLWDIQTGKCHQIIKMQWSVKHVSFFPTNPQHFISISSGDVQQWDLDGHPIKSTYKGSHAAFSLDGTHLALCGGKTTTIQNSNSGAIVAKCPTDKDPKCCCFSPNGRLVAVIAGTTAYVWDITGSDPHLIKAFTGHTSSITSLTFSSPSSLISVSNDRSVRFWQIGALSTDLVTSDPELTPSASASIKSVSLQAENGIAISSDFDGVVRTWDISTSLCKASFQTPAKGEILRDAQIVDGRLIVVWRWDGKIHIWDTKKGKLLQVVEGPQDSARDLRISGDGSKVFLLAGGFIRAWSVWTGEAVGEVKLDWSYLCLLHTGGSRAHICFPNSLTLGWDFGVSGSSPIPLPNTSLERVGLDFVGGADWWYKGLSWVRDTITGQVVFQLAGRYAIPHSVQWDGQYLVAGYKSGEVLIMDFNQMLPQ
jgi:WD40 repeat protein